MVACRPYRGGCCPLCDAPAVRQLEDNTYGQPQYEDAYGHRWFTAFAKGQERPRQAVLPLAGEE